MPLWVPKQIENTNIYKYMSEKGFKTYFDLYDWTIRNPEIFWTDVWSLTGIKGDLNGTRVLKNPDRVKEAVFFEDATLNFAENILASNSDETAIYFVPEIGDEHTLTFKQLKDKSIKLAKYLKCKGIKSGDCVAGYMPNVPETIIAMLATTSIGAVWTACSPDFAVPSVLDRLQQVNPKILVMSDCYTYNGKEFKYLDRAQELLDKLPSVQELIVVSKEPSKFTNLHEILSEQTADDFVFEQFPFNHPLYILYSSGTTGIPKCIVHGAGGTLIEHKKEHYFHADTKPGDRVFYFTTCSWMMWHWLISALSLKASIVLYDGSPMYPTYGRLFEMAESKKINFLGVSAKYLSALQKEGYTTDGLNLDSLHYIGSTGSPLLPETFDYVYESLKKDVDLSSLSGGTDIVGCFVFGCPILPVYRGELQSITLGIALDIVDEMGEPTNKGEMICRQPFPSRPIGFWNDADGTKYHKAYYDRFDNIWHHGDFVERTEHNGLIIHGRSDSTLNPGGIRIGTAEIYRQVDAIPEVLESLAVGQVWDGDERIVLFVVLKGNASLTEDLKQTIRHQIRTNTTPRHVPSKIIQVPDLPRTKNGKITELAVKQIIQGMEVKNKSILANPEVLSFFSNLEELSN